MRKLATIRKISNIKPIPGADKIECLIIDGWEVVGKKGDYAIGDMCIYIEIDSIVPDIPYFDFMKDRKFRVRTIKLRKQISQGLAVPINEETNKVLLKNKGFELGDDVSDLIGVTKWVPPHERVRVSRMPKNVGLLRRIRLSFRDLFKPPTFPRWIKKTDEDRIQNISDTMLQNWNDQDNAEYIITEKLDGCSATYFIESGLFGWNFGVCSRNRWLRQEDDSHWWKIAKQYDLKYKLKDLCITYGFRKLCIQGEIIGEGVGNGSGKNLYDIKGVDFYVFNMFTSIGKVWYDHKNKLCEMRDIKVVPEIWRGPNIPNRETIMFLCNRKSELKDVMAEGIVLRDYKDKRYFKAINPEFLLKHNI
jgi:hypothetical protein